MEVQQLAAQLGRENLMGFCEVYDKNYTANWHHEVLARALEKVENGETKRLIIEMPPRHGKSQLASIYFPAWYLGRNPEREIITCSYSAELARDFGGKTRDTIGDSQYQAIFPTRLKADSKSKDKWNTEKGGSYTSVGIGGPITGRGANLLIIDDPIKNREEAESLTIREKIWDWYTSTAYTRLEKGAAVVVIMTRWHLDDLVGRLMDRQEKGGETWEVVRFPAIADEQEEKREVGEPLWKDKYDVDSLDQIKNTIGIYDWYALYQQLPIATETQEFKKEWFRYFDDVDLYGKEPDGTVVSGGKNLYYYITVDLAISQKEQADNTSIMVLGKEKTSPDIYIVDEYTGHLDPLQVIEYLFSLKEKYKHRLVRVGIESVAYQKSLEYFIREEQRKRETYFDIVELKAASKKETRIRGLKAMYKAGVIWHRKDQRELENELLMFPKGRHDDRIDSLAYCQQVLKGTVRDTNKTFRPTFNYKR